MKPKYFTIVTLLTAVLPLFGQSLPNRQINIKPLSADQPLQPQLTGALEVKSDVVQPGESIHSKLAEGGINPNSDSLSVVYDLNPSIKDLDQVKPGQNIMLPAVKRLDNNGFPAPVSLEVDRNLKTEIQHTSTRVEDTLAQMSRERKAEFEEPTHLLDQISKQVFTHPVSQEMLNQVKDESALLNTLIHKSGFTAEDRSKVRLLKEDLESKTRALQIDAPDPLVLVRTIRNKDQVEIKPYTICYMPVALFTGANCGKTFNQPSSPTEQRLAVANYEIWAVAPGNPKPASEVKRVEVRTGSIPPVVLLIK